MAAITSSCDLIASMTFCRVEQSDATVGAQQPDFIILHLKSHVSLFSPPVTFFPRDHGGSALLDQYPKE
jgi:hypothetical protein